MLEDEELLLDEISSAAAEYSCETNDPEFEILVKIKCSDGWVSAEIIK